MKSIVLITLFFTLLSSSYAHERVLDHDFPDPSLIKAQDGWYYAYGTQGTSELGVPQIFNLQLARSKDLKSWEHLGEALPEKPTWASTTQAFWAPHIHFAHGRYYLYYSADPDTKTGLCLAVATSPSPRGPFIDSGKPLLCGPSFTNIDPMIYEHAGKSYMYWGSAFEPVRMRELDPSLTKFATDSETLLLIAPSTEPYTKLLEGAWVHKENGYYYLFVSGENCCAGENPQYAVLVLRSKNFNGPFAYRENDPRKSVVIESEGQFSATGHNALITDKEGTLWSFHHGVDSKHPLLSFPIPGDRSNRRVLLRKEVRFVDGWPVSF